MHESISPYAKLIAALGETMSDNDWATDILAKCAQIQEAVNKIARIANDRKGGER